MRVVITSFLFLCFTSLKAQEFPGDFIGHWEGELNWFKAGKEKPQNVRMQLIIKATDTTGQYTWQLIYGDKNEDNRPYILRCIDSLSKHWVIDERNGIVLDQFWIGKRFAGAFTVQTSTIINNYWIEDGNLLVEFYTISSTAVNTTGGTGNDIPTVQSYTVKSYQKAVLKKKKP